MVNLKSGGAVRTNGYGAAQHSMHTANRFAYKAAPALTRVRELVADTFIEGIGDVREKIVARTDEDHAVLPQTQALQREGRSCRVGHRQETVDLL